MNSCLAIGVDLAWSGRNPTGLAAARWDGSHAVLLASPVTLITDDQIIDYVQAWDTDPEAAVMVAIDAPTLVPNSTGRRPAEAELSTVFRRFDAGAHPANRTRLGGYNNGEVRGEVIVARLTALDIRHSPYIQPRQRDRACFEVYPHPAMVALFGLTRTLKYKAKPHFTALQRLAALTQYCTHLRALQNADPPLDLPDELLMLPLEGLTARALKTYEDQLDAVFCAYIALYYWIWGVAKCRIFGDLQSGYIVTPVDDRTW